MTSVERDHDYPSVPQVVGIETINACNARCPFCPLFQGKDTLDRSLFPATTMSRDLFEKVVTDIATWREAPQVIYLNMNGEPLLDRFFEQRLIVLRKHGIHRLINIQSNGEFLDEKKAEAILSNAIGAISIGFDGATKDTYERHRVNCHYERVLENIKRFVRLRRKLGSDTQVVIKCVVTPQNIHELLQIAELFRDLLDSGRDLVDASLSLNWGSSWLETNGFIFDTVAPLRQYPASGCQLFASQLVILANGAIAACCFDYNLKVRPGPIANAEEEDLLAIWNGQARREILRLLAPDVIERKPPKCRECTFSYKRKPLRAEDFGLTKNDVLMETDFGVVGINCNLKQNVPVASEEIVLSAPFQCELGYAWQSQLRQYASIADNLQYLYRSPLVLYEDDRPLGPRHSQHNEIRRVGLGSFSHWGDIVLFSTSDNSDPNINGRKYKAIFPRTRSG